jgi:DNA-binding NtrC family response regulator
MENAPRLLFVDDEPNIRTLLSTILKKNGFDVTVAGTVAEALNLISSQPFDVLLSDLNIGEAGDGFTIVSAMRRTQPEAATFILTGYPAFESALEAIRQQVDDYFVKPADIDGMIGKIRSRLVDPTIEKRRLEPRRLTEVLTEHKREIFSRWLAAAKADEQIRLRPMSDEELADHMPMLIEEIVGRPHQQKLSAGANGAAERHGLLRFRQGFTIPLLIREMRILHEVISRLVQENLLAVEISSLITDIMDIGETIQAFLEESTRSFLHARHAIVETEAPQKGRLILLLSRDRELSLLRYSSLRQAGYSVERADSRQEALSLLRDKFDALVISYSLSLDSLAEFTELFRSTNPNSPVIGVVKENWQDLKVKLDFAVNGDDGPEALLEAVDTALKRKQLRLVK